MERTACVTGFNRGIGFEVAAGLVDRGFHVVGVCRSKEKGEDAMRRLRRRSPDASVDYLVADLSGRSEIEQAASEYARRFDGLDVLVNNAGLISSKKHVTPDGLELTFAVNCMAPYFLTRLLLPALAASSPSRVVNVSSDAQNGGTLDYELFAGQARYSAWKAYAGAKLALTVLSVEMAERLAHADISVYAVHPGFVPSSGFVRGVSPVLRPLMMLARLLPVAKSVRQGARTPLYAAVSDEVEGRTGIFLRDSEQASLPASATDDVAREKLWRFLADATGSDEALTV